jgi:hypothetical protein
MVAVQAVRESIKLHDYLQVLPQPKQWFRSPSGDDVLVLPQFGQTLPRTLRFAMREKNVTILRAIEVTFLGEWLVGGNDTYQLYC